MTIPSGALADHEQPDDQTSGRHTFRARQTRRPARALGASARLALYLRAPTLEAQLQQLRNSPTNCFGKRDQRPGKDDQTRLKGNGLRRKGAADLLGIRSEQDKDAHRHGPDSLDEGRPSQAGPTRVVDWYLLVLRARQGQAAQAGEATVLRRGQVMRNVAKQTRLLKVRRPRRTTWTSNEARRFLEYARVEDQRFYTACVLLLVLVSRRGRSSGSRGVRSTWTRASSRPTSRCSELASETSEQPLPLPNICFAAPSAHRLMLEEMGKPTGPDDPLFSMITGSTSSRATSTGSGTAQSWLRGAADHRAEREGDVCDVAQGARHPPEDRSADLEARSGHDHDGDPHGRDR